MQLVDLNRDQIETVNFLSYTTDTKRCAVVNLFGIFVTDVLHLLYYDVILGEKEDELPKVIFDSSVSKSRLILVPLEKSFISIIVIEEINRVALLAVLKCNIVKEDN